MLRKSTLITASACSGEAHRSRNQHAPERHIDHGIIMLAGGMCMLGEAHRSWNQHARWQDVHARRCTSIAESTCSCIPIAHGLSMLMHINCSRNHMFMHIDRSRKEHSHKVDGPATPKAVAATHVLNLTVTLRRKEKAAMTSSMLH